MMAVASLQLRPIPRLLPARNGGAGTSPRMADLSGRYNQSTNVQGRTRLRSHIARRDALSFMSSAVLAAFVLMVASPAEARTSRSENKKKALEKLREKALGAKEKNGATGKEMQPPANLLIPRPAVQASL